MLDMDQHLKIIEKIVETDEERDRKLFQICEYLFQKFSLYDWVGFYEVNAENPSELILGTYFGEPTEHTHIPFGKGVCGQVAHSHQTMIVDDVSHEENYIACSLDVKSEIVIPIFKEGDFVAQLDIDSNTSAAISKEDKQFLEAVCKKIETVF